MMSQSGKRVHIITPDGVEVATTKGIWDSMPEDWKSLASCLDCPKCTTEIGQPADHAAGQINVKWRYDENTRR